LLRNNIHFHQREVTELKENQVIFGKLKLDDLRKPSGFKSSEVMKKYTDQKL